MLFEFSIEVDETVEGGFIASTRTYEGEAAIERAAPGASYAWVITGIELDCGEVQANGTLSKDIVQVALATDSHLFRFVAAELMCQCAGEIDRAWHANARDHREAREAV